MQWGESLWMHAVNSIQSLFIKSRRLSHCRGLADEVHTRKCRKTGPSRAEVYSAEALGVPGRVCCGIFCRRAYRVARSPSSSWQALSGFTAYIYCRPSPHLSPATVYAATVVWACPGVRTGQIFSVFLTVRLSFLVKSKETVGNSWSVLSYFGSQISQSFIVVHIYRLQPKSATQCDFVSYILVFKCFESASRIANGERNRRSAAR